MMTDPIADMLTRIRNASQVGKTEVIVPYSRLKARIADILQQEGFIAGMEAQENPKALRIHLKYIDQKAVITSLRRISKPGRKVYRGFNELPRVRQGMGRVILSTSQGLMTDQMAKEKKVGGELLFEVY